MKNEISHQQQFKGISFIILGQCFFCGGEVVGVCLETKPPKRTFIHEMFFPIQNAFTPEIGTCVRCFREYDAKEVKELK